MKKIDLENSLTIAIPTYNRIDSLMNQLRAIDQNADPFLYEVIVIDNNSSECFENRLKEFKNLSIRLIKNSFNVGQSTNQEMPFLYCTTRYLWLLSDDDEVLPDSIKTIEEDVNKGDAVLYKYPLQYRETEVEIFSLEHLVTFVNENSDIGSGELIFYSNCVYDVRNARDHLTSAFDYSSTYIGFLFPAFEALKHSHKHLKYMRKPIVKYKAPIDGGYSYIKVLKALLTLRTYETQLDSKFNKQFFLKFISITPRTLLVYCIKNNITLSKFDFSYMYDNYFKLIRKQYFIEILVLKMMAMKWIRPGIVKQIIKKLTGKEFD